MEEGAFMDKINDARLLIAFIGFLVFFACLEITLVNALDFDNVVTTPTTTFDGKRATDDAILTKYPPLKVVNTFGIGETLAEAYISEHTSYCDDNCSSNIKIKLYSEGSLIDDIQFYTMQGGITYLQDIKSHRFLLKTGEKEVDKIRREWQCTPTGKIVNGSINEEVCGNVDVVYKEIVPVYEDYQIGQIVSAGVYEIRLEGQKKANRVVDWQIKSNGIWTTEWATWGGIPASWDYGYDDGASYTSIGPSSWRAQSFTLPASRTLEKLNMTLLKQSGTPGTCWISITNTTTTKVSNNIISTATIDGTALAGTYANITIDIPNVFLAGGREYWIMINCTGDEARWKTANPGSFTSGRQDYSSDAGATWTGADYGQDSDFRLYLTSSGSTIVQNSPVDHFNSSISSVQFNCSVIMVGATLVNKSIWTNKTGTWAISNTTATDINMSLNFSDGVYKWSCNACDSDGDCGFAETNRTITIDTVSPVITIVSPTENQTFYNSTNQIAVQIKSYITHAGILDDCWYNTGNGTNVTKTCGTNETANFSSGYSTVVEYANDSTGNLGTASRTFFYNRVQSNQSYSNAIIENENTTICHYLNTTLLSNYSVILTYNGTAYNMTSTVSGNNLTSCRTVYAPTVPSNQTILFYINYTINSNFSGSSGILNQTVMDFAITDCMITNGDRILNLTQRDEELNTLIPNNSTIELDLTITSLTNSSNQYTFSKLWTNNQTVSVCIPSGILTATSYQIDFTVGFDADSHVREFYYMDNGTLDNTDYFNSYTDNTIELMDLATADSTTFLFSFTDEDGLEVDNAIVHTFRKYIGEGLFREVERSQEDNNGETHVHLVEEDVIYYFMVTQYGEIVYTSDTYNAKCLSTPCEISLSASPTEANWSIIDNEGGQYSVTVNRTTRIVTTTFLLDSSSLVNVSLYKIVNGVQTKVNQTSTTAISGSLPLYIPVSYGNTSFFVAIYRNNVFVKSEWVSLKESARDFFGSTGAIFGGLIILAIILMAVSEGAVLIVFTILAIIIIAVMNFVELGWLSVISLACAGGIIVWKLISRRNKG